jgi:hypothetical protein
MEIFGIETGLSNSRYKSVLTRRRYSGSELQAQILPSHLSFLKHKIGQYRDIFHAGKKCGFGYDTAVAIEDFTCRLGPQPWMS